MTGVAELTAALVEVDVTARPTTGTISKGKAYLQDQCCLPWPATLWMERVADSRAPTENFMLIKKVMKVTKRNNLLDYDSPGPALEMNEYVAECYLMAGMFESPSGIYTIKGTA